MAVVRYFEQQVGNAYAVARCVVKELPQITVRLEEGHTTYRFTGSFDGKHTLPEKAVKLADEQKGV